MLGLSHLGEIELGNVPSSTAYALQAEAGAFEIAGQAALSAQRGSAEAGAFVIGGQAVHLNLSMPAAAGAFVITGQDASEIKQFVLTASHQSALAGLNPWVGFTHLGNVALGQGAPLNRPTYRISGGNVTLSLSMPASAGAFVINGQNARLQDGAVINPDVGAFVVTGYGVNAHFSMPAEAGAFAIAGQQAELARRTTAKIRAFPRVGRATISARPTGRDGIKIRAYGG